MEVETDDGVMVVDEKVTDLKSHRFLKNENNADFADKHKKKVPVVLDRQVPFDIKDLFFSITDQKSNIQFANQTFIDLSGYSEDELMGELHKIIRHPDMPRTIFKIFWDYLLLQKPVASYVKNRAKDGSYYWVMALAFPCKGGYLSIRLKPESDHFSAVVNLYKSILKYEKEQEITTDKRKALDSTESFILKELEEMGFDSYDEFMWFSLEKEMQFRENALTYLEIEQRSDSVPSQLRQLQTVLITLFKNTGTLNRMHQELMKHSDYLLKLARSILKLSLNAQVGSAKLDQKNQYMSVVAENMSEQSVIGEKKLIEMQLIVSTLNDLLSKLNFNIISSKLQVEMNNHFLEEINSDSQSYKNSIIHSEEAVEYLTDSFLPRIYDIRDQIKELPFQLRKLSLGVDEIEKFLHTLRFIHVTGIIEVARLDDHSGSFATTFHELIKQIEYAESKMTELTDFLKGNVHLGRIFNDNRYVLEDYISWTEMNA